MRYVCLIVALLVPSICGGAEPVAPAQPTVGPGGAAYPHAAIRTSRHGKGDHEFWIFEPTEPKPVEPAPMVVFIHGWGAMSPNIYGAWIEHLVLRGNIVVFPRYQRDMATASVFFTDNTVHAVRNAVNTLRRDDHVIPDMDRVVFAGHSVGGVLAPNLAARADGRFVPRPAAVFSIQPGITQRPGKWWGVPLEDLRKIDRQTLLVTCAGTDDGTTGDHDARRIYRAAANVPGERKSMLLYRTDRHGEPDLVADHRSPAALKAIVDERATAGEARTVQRGGVEFRGLGKVVFSRFGSETVNAMDHHGYWAVLDRLIAAAGSDDRRLAVAAIGAGEADRSLGKWSDGRAIVPPLRIKP